MMIETSAVFDAYINANILLIVAYFGWLTVTFGLDRAGFGGAHTARLSLLNGVFLAILFTPVVVVAYGAMLSAGALPPGVSLSVSDFVVAQYLNGGFAMKPTEFESVMDLRATLSAQILSMSSVTGMVIASALIAGFVWFAAKLALNIRTLRSIIRDSHLWRRFGVVELRLSDRVSVPFSTRGWRRRYVVIPSAMLADSADLKMALAHEFQHLRHSDLEWEIALEFLRPLFFWNPVFFLWKRRVEHLRELACDQRVLATRRFDVADYCECLLRVCRDSLARRAGGWGAVPRVALVATDGHSPATAPFLRQRFTAMLDGGRGRYSRAVNTGLMIALVLLISTVAVSIQKTGDWSHDRLMLSTIVNLERLEVINTFGQRRP
ncbi:MAG: hypothetical protein GKR99_02575 [Rhodobacteraceae bacterium]|nr:hypothetical protein [Paracoccaceae bacterium]